jgi:hypothetical protein
MFHYVGVCHVIIFPKSICITRLSSEVLKNGVFSRRTVCYNNSSSVSLPKVGPHYENQNQTSCNNSRNGTTEKIPGLL